MGDAKVKIALDPMKPRRLNIGCSVCSGASEHQGAALSLILEENLLAILSAKHELSLAVLDPESDKFSHS